MTTCICKRTLHLQLYILELRQYKNERDTKELKIKETKEKKTKYNRLLVKLSKVKLNGYHKKSHRETYRKNPQ